MSRRRSWAHPFADPARTLPWAAVLLLSLVLASWGNRWGAPKIWHPDEITASAMAMARDRTANPHTFFYGALPRLAVVGGVIVPVRLYARAFDPRPEGAPDQLAAWRDRQAARVVQGARFLTAAYQVALVAIVGAVGWLLFGEAVGLLAALWLATAELAVVLAHFATVDIGATMWYWAACLCALVYWLRQRGAAAFYAACFLGGLAAGVKADRGLVVVVLLVSWLLRADRSWRTLLLGLCLAVPAGYVVANPPLLTSPFEYLDGFTRDLFYNALRGGGRGARGYGYMVVNVPRRLGIPLGMLAAIAAVYAVVRLWQQHRRDTLVWILATCVPYFIVVGRGLVLDWYLQFFFPPLLLLAASGCVELGRNLARVPRFVLAALIAGVTIATLARMVGLLRYFTEDARADAESWIARHVPAGDTVVTIGSELNLPHGRYTVHALPSLGCTNHLIGRDRLMASSTYRTVQTGIRDLELWSARHLGTAARPEPYRAWFDHLAVACAQRALGAQSFAPADSLGADFIVIVAGALDWELTADRPDPRFVQAARFDPPMPRRPPPVEFVGKGVRIYRRTEGGAARRTPPLAQPR